LERGALNVRRLGVFCGMERGEELSHIGNDRLRVEPNTEAVRLEDGSCGYAGRFQLMAQGGERHAEAMASDLWVGFGPEHLDEEFAGMVAVKMESQVGEQGGRLLSAKSSDGSLALDNLQTAQ
jgi:hypothetical protein